MNAKKIFSAILAASLTMSFAAAFSAPAMAQDSGVISLPGQGGYSASTAASNGYVVSGDTTSPNILTTGGSNAIQIGNGTIALDTVNPNQTFYIWVGQDAWRGAIADYYVSNNGTFVTSRDLGDKDLFSMKIEKDGDGKSLIKEISQVANKNYGGTATGNNRGTYLKVVLGDSTTTTDLKANAKLTFKARKDHDARNVTTDGTFKSGDTLVLNVNMWINNSNGSENPDVGDRIYYDPIKNDTNTVVWGDDRASLKFDADSDTSKFYARLSTKNDSALYAQYGDPVNADLWFYDFVSNPTVPSTSRATLTLGIPWEDDDAYIPDPAACFIYQKDADGNLTDVTDLFTYSEDVEEIPGWSIKTRQLGTYIVSDTELEIEVVTEDDILPDDTTDVVTPDPEGGKVIPDTGASDMVNVAVVAAIVSLAAAGAVAFKKSSK